MPERKWGTSQEWRTTSNSRYRPSMMRLLIREKIPRFAAIGGIVSPPYPGFHYGLHSEIIRKYNEACMVSVMIVIVLRNALPFFA